MECTKHVVKDQRDITIRDLRAKVAELEGHCDGWKRKLEQHEAGIPHLWELNLTPKDIPSVFYRRLAIEVSARISERNKAWQAKAQLQARVAELEADNKRLESATYTNCLRALQHDDGRATGLEANLMSIARAYDFSNEKLKAAEDRVAELELEAARRKLEDKVAEAALELCERLGLDPNGTELADHGGEGESNGHD